MHRTTTTPWRARLIGIAAALVMATGLLTTTTAPASAVAMSCDFRQNVVNACLTIDYAGNGRWNVSVGFDRYLPKNWADEILRCPSSVVFSVLWSHDSSDPGNDLGSIPLVAGSPNTGSNPEGLFADFHRDGMNLNAQDGTDTIVAEVTYYDCHIDQWMTYSTGVLVGDF
jgi:hypothetical protein